MELNKHALQEACQVIELYLDKRKITPYRKIILRNLLDITLQQIENADSFPIEFETQALYIENYQDTRDVSRWYDSISPFLEKQKDIIIQIARENGFHYYFQILKTEEDGGKSFYSIIAIKIPEKKYALPPYGIEYVPDDIKIPFFIQWLDGFTLLGWRKFLFLIFMAAIILGIVFSLVMINPTYYKSSYHWIQGIFLFSVLSAWLYWVFRPFKLAIDNRIVDSPQIFLPITAYHGQLESTIDSNNNRFFRIIVYKSQCPICNSRIDVMNGKKQHFHRMIGRCSLSPVEHIFSFDPETKIGLPLNPDIPKIIDVQK